MHRLQYRIINGVRYLVTNHTVNVGSGTTTTTYRAGVRWYQLASSGGAFSVQDQGTFAPADTTSRWMGGAALDAYGNLAIGYSASGLTTYPAVRYTGRLATDPPGTMAAEQSIVEVSGVQRSTGGRWGDYSALTVDPVDDCTFWFTSEYYTAAGQAASTVGWQTRIGSFRIGTCAALPSGTLQGTVSNGATFAPLSGVALQISGGFGASTDANGFYQRTLPPGSYTVTASKFGYQTATANVSVTDGGVTTQDFALTPLPVMQAAGAAITAEGFSPPNGALDPAETVTVGFTLANTGTGATSNLVATLVNTGGVLDSSGSATYSVIGANSGTGTQSFTFRVDPNLACGATLVATLQLQDGATNLGTVTYNFTLGSQSIMLVESFDAVAAPSLPAGWSATVAAGLSTNNWRTVTTIPDSAPNDAFVPDTSTVHDVRLDSPAFAVPTSGAQLTFRNSYATEAGFDGGVLEISINGGAFADILAAGGSFASGGYNRTISTGFSSPIAGRQAWSGNSGGYITTVANLPPAAAGQNVQLRWRLGSDSSVAGTGWRVDGVSIFGGFQCATNPAPTVTATPAAQSVQYSDAIAPVTVTATESTLDLPLAFSTQWKLGAGAFQAGLSNGLSLADNGCTTAVGIATCTRTLSGQALVAPGVYVVRVTVADALGASASTDITLTVTQEDARATYTGALYVSTSSPTSSAAQVTLAATVQDITAVAGDPAYDTYPGDIRNATVTFVNRDAGNAVLCANLPVGLVSAGDTKTGAATCTWNVDIGSANSKSFTVGVIVNNYYTRNSTADDTIVTVARPLASSFISGGGYLLLSNPAGIKAGDPGSKNNFGFDVKYNKSGTNLQGSVSSIVRRTESGVMHVYQIKGNVMTSLAVQPGAGTATFNGKASIKDVTDPANPISVDGNATLQIVMTDRGDPGANDSLAITVWNKNGGVWFASSWSGTTTVEQTLGGGQTSNARSSRVGSLLHGFEDEC